jgi:hypothetical protein
MSHEKLFMLAFFGAIGAKVAKSALKGWLGVSL